MKPLVSVVCLCYNHKRFVRQAVLSVINQTYSPIQIIVADDASPDGSAGEIEQLKEEYPSLELVLLPVNVGNCKAFNIAYQGVTGDFVIDFATDDIMSPDRIEKQVSFFLQQSPQVGVIFTDATYVDVGGTIIRHHFEYLFKKKLLHSVPQGDVYRDVLSTYFIPAPTMMVRRQVFEELTGYDELLTYEDFDFWVRSSRTWHYAFLNERLTLVRKVVSSMSNTWYVPGDRQLHSTYLVCQKAQRLNRDAGDQRALIQRARYEFRQSVLSGNHEEAALFYAMIRSLRGMRIGDGIWLLLNRFRIPLSPLRKIYHRLRYS